jgi:hypothetical protein
VYEGIEYVGDDVDSVGANTKIEKATRLEDAEAKGIIRTLKM